MQSRHRVTERNRGAHRIPVAVAREGAEARHRLDDLAERDVVTVRPTVAEARHRDHHQPRVDRGEGLVGQPEVTHDPPAEVLDHDIGPRHQFLQHLAAALEPQVERDRPLVTVDLVEPAANVPRVGRGRLVARREAEHVGPHTRLDLDDVGAKVGEEHGAVGPGHDLGLVQHADAVEGGGRRGRRHRRKLLGSHHG